MTRYADLVWSLKELLSKDSIKPNDDVLYRSSDKYVKARVLKSEGNGIYIVLVGDRKIRTNKIIPMPTADVMRHLVSRFINEVGKGHFDFVVSRNVSLLTNDVAYNLTFIDKVDNKVMPIDKVFKREEDALVEIVAIILALVQKVSEKGGAIDAKSGTVQASDTG